MRNDSKSGLRISQIVLTFMAFIIMTTSTQLLVSNKNENKETQIANKTETEENIIINTARVATTSRGNVDRGSTTNIQENEQEETQTYITIEEIKISKDMDLTKRCGISKEDFKELMKNTKKDTTKFFYENSDTIYDLCEKYEINEIFFCGLIAGESGWNIASNHRRTHNYISMMQNGKLIKFNSTEEGLEEAAKLLHTKYLSENGKFYHGKTLSSVKKVFCPNSTTWVNLIYTCMSQIV